MVITGPPYIRAVASSHTVPSGSNITLACMIVNPGEPRVSFGWKKDGKSINSTYFITTNDSFTAITLTSVTVKDSGTYTCTATGIESYHSDSMQMQVTSNITIGMYVCIQ